METKNRQKVLLIAAAAGLLLLRKGNHPGNRSFDVFPDFFGRLGYRKGIH